jgi:spore maturation protein A
MKDTDTGIFTSIQDTVSLCIKLFGGICFWCGVMNIITNTSLQEKIKKLIKPLNSFLFPKINQNGETYKYISINMVTNMIGIGNAATPAGLQVMENLENEANKNESKLLKLKTIKNEKENIKKVDKINKSKELTDDMLMFLVINTASLQIIPTNVIAIRSSLGSKSPGLIIVGVWFSSIIAFTTIVLLTKLYIIFRKNNL